MSDVIVLKHRHATLRTSIRMHIVNIPMRMVAADTPRSFDVHHPRAALLLMRHLEHSGCRGDFCTRFRGSGTWREAKFL